SPFSFFNVFSANPPVLIFSPARRVRDNTVKHTLNNVEAIKEVVINVINYDLVYQMSLASAEYAQDVNEFEKAGLTMLASDVVKPFRVAESPIQFECKVNEVVALGTEGGAGNLVICEVLKFH
ncbi:flavin reductase family protein, partial [Aquimarina sp. U1-2]